MAAPFETRPDDVVSAPHVGWSRTRPLTRGLDQFIVSYPKSGTTWTQQIVRLILARGDLAGDTRRVTEVIPWFEEMSVDAAAQVAPPRIFKSHTPYRMIAGHAEAAPPRYIYVARHPKDTAVSAFHHHRGFLSFGYEGDWDDFFALFCAGRVESGPWHAHVLGWWARRKDPNVFFLRYEDMHRDLPAAVRAIAAFIGVPALNAAEESLVVAQSGFEAMRVDPSCNYSWTASRRRPAEPPFMRRGETGDWRRVFTPAQSAHWDRLCAHFLQGSGLSFPDDPPEAAPGLLESTEFISE
jgi:hypothetical protein